ncbi:MAG TPA: glycoside hydrolase family 99-like domain-containing protein, partial [Candidatus Paceibacterota bacterium]|nr:glycoside hydrolase family 99-like domain-containing protein [Candidatus Paceibacterota bacterium]
AADHGIDAFIFDWYHYEDGPFLDRTVNEGFLKAKNNGRIKFAFMWANHDWIKNLFPYSKGDPQAVLYPGKVSPAGFDRIADHLLKDYFRHPSYWRIEGKPYFSFYDLGKLLESFGSVPATRAALDAFRAKAVRAGLSGLHLNAVVWGQPILPGEKVPADPAKLVRDLGFDSVTSYVWIHHFGMPQPQTDYDVVRDGYFRYWDQARILFGVPYYPNVSMGWDPSPRCDQRQTMDNSGYPFTSVIVGNTPEKSESALRLTQERLLADPKGPRILNINCWNEWTEGSYLEPDTVHGTKYLEAVRAVFGVRAADSGRKPASPRPAKETVGPRELIRRRENMPFVMDLTLAALRRDQDSWFFDHTVDWGCFNEQGPSGQRATVARATVAGPSADPVQQRIIQPTARGGVHGGNSLTPGFERQINLKRLAQYEIDYLTKNGAGPSSGVSRRSSARSASGPEPVG